VRPLVIERSRGVLRVGGRDPMGMLHGLATADVREVTAHRGVYTAFLTPKGRMVADARVFRPDDAAAELLIDTAPDAVPGLAGHLARFVPPLFARAEDVSDQWAVVGVYGPGADDAAQAAFPALGGPDALPGDRPEETVVPLAGGFAARTLLTGDEGWDFFVHPDRAGAVAGAVIDAGGRAGAPGALEALRVAAGRPRWGRELTEEVIPLEAELLDRAISQTKGCYTGQEVIVRILHRGHVNRHLRRLEFAGVLPEPGTELFEPGNPKSRGVVTSAVENEVGALGLGYVRREVEPPAELRVGSPDGDPVRVTGLE
jgi:folate-binding protein YgfZ